MRIFAGVPQGRGFKRLSHLKFGEERFINDVIILSGDRTLDIGDRTGPSPSEIMVCLSNAAVAVHWTDNKFISTAVAPYRMQCDHAVVEWALGSRRRRPSPFVNIHETHTLPARTLQVCKARGARWADSLA